MIQLDKFFAYHKSHSDPFIVGFSRSSQFSKHFEQVVHFILVNTFTAVNYYHF